MGNRSRFQPVFGEGLITEYDGIHIKAEFSVGEKSFQIPRAFEEGFLKSEYPGFLDDLKKKLEIESKIDEFSNEIASKKEQLKNIVI